AAATKSPVTTAKIKAAGISLGYPKAWTAAPLTKQALKEMRKNLHRTSPEAADALEGASTEAIAGAAKLFAIDLAASASGEFANNVNVIVVKSADFPGSLDDFTTGVASYYQGINAVLETTAAVKIGRKVAYRADASYALQLADGSATSLHIAQLVLANGKSSDVITVTTTDDAASDRITDDLFASVRYL
ncbi:MAG: hypothetical protein WEB19_02745, partial [Acidimicrobiia bacterium]